MELKDRIIAFDKLGVQLNSWLNAIEEGKENELEQVIESARHHNGWFDKSQVLNSLNEILQWLNVDALTDWTNNYNLETITETKTIGVIMAGNIPLVGFHDYLSVLISGHKILAKLSSKDEVLIRFLNKELQIIEPRFKGFTDFSTERFTNIDAVIATGSDNSAKYFEYYFAKMPNIIRKNRTSIAVLTGKESKEEMHQLGNDIFKYYGLGCRNITKIYLPKGFSIDWFYEGILDHGDIINNHKYQNNYDYHKSLFLLNGENLWDNNFLMLKKDTAISSPVGVLYYEEYDDINDLKKELEVLQPKIQCSVGVFGFSLGEAQSPKLSDYSDNIDVLDFLLGV